MYNGMKLTKQVAFRILEIGLFEESGTVSNLSKRIRLNGGLYANVADKAAVDAIQGTKVWNVTKVEFPNTLNRIYCSMMRFYVNSSTTASLENSIAVLDQGT